MKINSLCFNEMLKYCTPLQIKKQVEANMHCSQVVFAPDKQKLPLELKDDENKLLSYPCVYRWLVPEDKAVSILGDECLLNKFEKKEINKIFFEGELYDAYSILLDILGSSKQEIIIIDNYAGKELLDILKKINEKIILVSKNIDETLKKKYESQYNNISFISNNSFHDRFIILDRNKLYSCGASFKDLGKKCFAINEFKERFYLNEILKMLNL